MISLSPKTGSRAKRKKSPKHAVVMRAYRFPLSVTPNQHECLRNVLFACWRLRNRLALDRIQDRKTVKELRRAGQSAKYLRRADQYEAVKRYATQDEGWASLHSQVRQNIAVRIDEGYKRFFDALKEGRTRVRPPRPIPFDRQRSFTYPQYGSAAFVRNGRLHLSGLGDFKVNAYRKIRGRKKTVTVKYAQGRWWCVVTAEIPAREVHPPIPANDPRPDAGIDTGLSALLTDSHGVVYDPPRSWHLYRSRLAAAQKKMARQFRERDFRWLAHVLAALSLGIMPIPHRRFSKSKRLVRQIEKVGRIHAKVVNVRDHHHKKNAARIADQYRRVAVEEHGLLFMIRNRRLAKMASDRAIHKQKMILASKLGPRYQGVANRRPGIGGNSQSCLCGTAVPKSLAERIHRCPACSLVAPRDQVSANIVQLVAFGTISPALARLAGSQSSCDGEAEKAACESRVLSPERASEASVKRKPSAKCVQGSTVGGEPTTEDHTSEHRPSPLPLAS